MAVGGFPVGLWRAGTQSGLSCPGGGLYVSVRAQIFPADAAPIYPVAYLCRDPQPGRAGAADGILCDALHGIGVPDFLYILDMVGRTDIPMDTPHLAEVVSAGGRSDSLGRAARICGVEAAARPACRAVFSAVVRGDDRAGAAVARPSYRVLCIPSSDRTVYAGR